MTAPRRLWSGDWQRESAEHAEELANRRAQTGQPAAARPAPDAARSTRSVRMLAVAWLQNARRRLTLRNAASRRAVLFVVTTLMAGGATYAVVSALTGSSAPNQATSSAAPGWL